MQMRALRLTWDALRASDLDCKLALSVHDELLLDAREDHAMEAATLLVDAMTLGARGTLSGNKKHGAGHADRGCCGCRLEPEALGR